METETARNWAQEFEGKGEFEIPDRAPPGLTLAEMDGWRLAQQAAKRAARSMAAREAADATPLADEQRADERTSEPLSEPSTDPHADPASETDMPWDDDRALAPVTSSRLAYFSHPAAALGEAVVAHPPFAHPQARPIRNSGDTEDLLNGLIAECHLLMRTVTLPTAMRAGDAETRARFLDSAMSLATTGAKVGRAVAKLRGAGVTQEIRQRHISERVFSGPAPLLENGAKM